MFIVLFDIKSLEIIPQLREFQICVVNIVLTYFWGHSLLFFAGPLEAIKEF